MPLETSIVKSGLAALAVAAAMVVAACGSSSPAPSIASPTAAATASATTTVAPTTPAPATPTATATPTPTRAPATATPASGSAAEQTVRTFVTASGEHVVAVAELPTAGTDEAGHALVAVLTDSTLQMYQVTDISVLPVGEPIALADVSFSVDAIKAWPGYAWPGAMWLEASGHNPYSLSVGLLSWDRANGWREQISWAEYATCGVKPVGVDDVDGDGVPEVALSNVGQASGAIPLCTPGAPPQLYRWTGGAMTEVRLADLPAGAPGAAENNQAVAAAHALDWNAAATAINAALTAAPSDPSVHWNAALISYRSAYRTAEAQISAQAVATAATGDFATAFRNAVQSSVPVAAVMNAGEAKQILAHAHPGVPDVSTADSAFAALPELTFRVAAREALAGTPDAGDPAALAADRDALAAAQTAVFGEPLPTATP